MTQPPRSRYAHEVETPPRQSSDESSGPRQPLPDHEFPIWLMRTSIKRGRAAFYSVLVGYQYARLARFAGDMKTCSRSSLGMTQALELCLKPHRNTWLGECWGSAVSEVQNGSSLTRALQPAAKRMPEFYLAVIDAGERGGRLEEAFAFLESHCKLLDAPAKAIRNVWLVPVCILLAGTVIKTSIMMFFGSLMGATQFLFGQLLSWLQTVILVGIVMLTPIRELFDFVRLRIPWLGDLEREIAVHRFFRVMALLDGVSEARVEAMIRTAVKTVSNQAARRDLLQAAGAIEEQATIAEAFDRVDLLTADERGMIAVGEMAGSMETCYRQIADDSEHRLMAKLKFLQPMLVRIVSLIVMFSILATVFGLLLG